MGTNLLENATHRLHKQQGRMTEQRRVILEILGSMSAHPTAEELYQLARAQNSDIHLSTVYRTLRWLQDEGLINGQFFPDQHGLERFDPNQPQEHFHFICQSCHQVIEFTHPEIVPQIVASFQQQHHAKVNSTSVTLYGLCKDCK